MPTYIYKISIYNSTSETIFGNKRFLETLKLRKQKCFREKWSEVFSGEVVQMPKKKLLNIFIEIDFCFHIWKIDNIFIFFPHTQFVYDICQAEEPGTGK